MNKEKIVLSILKTSFARYFGRSTALEERDRATTSFDLLLRTHLFASDQAREVHVKLDDRIISPEQGFLLRKGQLLVDKSCKFQNLP